MPLESWLKNKTPNQALKETRKSMETKTEKSTSQAPSTSTSALETSSSAPSTSTTSGVLPLPTPKRRGRPPGSKNSPKLEVVDEAIKSVSGKGKLKPLPESAEELDRVLAMYKVLARPGPEGISMAFEMMDMEPLSAAEIDSGQTAIAACLYQYGAQFNCWFLLGMWGFGIGIPRLTQMLAAKKEKEAKKNGVAQTPASVVPVARPQFQPVAQTEVKHA